MLPLVETLAAETALDPAVVEGWLSGVRVDPEARERLEKALRARDFDVGERDEEAA